MVYTSGSILPATFGIEGSSMVPVAEGDRGMDIPTGRAPIPVDAESPGAGGLLYGVNPHLSVLCPQTLFFFTVFV